MKAIGLTSYGGPEVLRPVDLPEPHVGRGDVRIRVRAAGVNPADVMLRDGSLAEWYRDLAPPFIPGMDVAGVIDEIGDEVDPSYGLALGGEVVGIVNSFASHGGYSEYVVLPAESVTQKPLGASFEDAASFLMNALTARAALDELALQPGATLLVTGAAGAVSGYVTQLGSSEGLHIVAIGSSPDEELLRHFGATTIIARGDNLADKVRALHPSGVDAAVDGALLFDQITPAIRDGGQIAILGLWDGDPGRGIAVRRVNVRNRAKDHSAITRLRQQVDDSALDLRVAGTYPAAQAPDAHRRLEEGGVRGRLVLRFADEV
jgi:NADPH:quinone reductase